MVEPYLAADHSLTAGHAGTNSCDRTIAGPRFTFRHHVNDEVRQPTIDTDEAIEARHDRMRLPAGRSNSARHCRGTDICNVRLSALRSRTTKSARGFLSAIDMSGAPAGSTSMGSVA